MFFKHLEHGLVGSQHVGGQALQPVLHGMLGQHAVEKGGDAQALVRFIYDKGHIAIGSAVVLDIASLADQLLLAWFAHAAAP